jgi:hypothetical protein
VHNSGDTKEDLSRAIDQFQNAALADKAKIIAQLLASAALAARGKGEFF